MKLKFLLIYRFIFEKEKISENDREELTKKIKSDDLEIDLHDLKTKFLCLNEQYHYFNEDSLPLFISLFKTRQFFKSNIETELNENDGYLDAYKLLVLFKDKANDPIKTIDKFVSNFLANSPNALLAILQFPLPIYHPKINYTIWRKHINTKGLKAIESFSYCNEIFTRHININSYDEIEKVILKITYINADEDYVMARLAQKYKFSSEYFSELLYLDKNKANDDYLPALSVAGSNAAKGYYLTKLPKTDKKIFFLGNITNCCMAIDGNGRQCLLDGINYEHNGFYALLKAKKKSSEIQNYYKDNAINDELFDVVGMGYSWISEFGNLTIDSWENLRAEKGAGQTNGVIVHDDDIAAELLIELAQKIVTETHIAQVTIGLGGKTPKIFKEKNNDYGSEFIREGQQYRDSYQQTTLASDKNKLNDNAVNVANKLFDHAQKNGIENIFVFQKIIFRKDYHLIGENSEFLKEFISLLTKENLEQINNDYSEELKNIADFLSENPQQRYAILLIFKHILKQNQINLFPLLNFILLKLDKSNTLAFINKLKNISIEYSFIKTLADAFHKYEHEPNFDAKLIFDNLNNLIKHCAKPMECIEFIFRNQNVSGSAANQFVRLSENELLDDRIMTLFYIAPNLVGAITDYLIFLKNHNLLETELYLLDPKQLITLNTFDMQNLRTAILKLNSGYAKFYPVLMANIKSAVDFANTLLNVDEQLLQTYEQLLFDKPQNAMQLMKALIILSDNNLLKEKIINFIVNSDNPEDDAYMLRNLSYDDFDFNSNWSTVDNHRKQLRNLTDLFYNLQVCGLPHDFFDLSIVNDLKKLVEITNLAIDYSEKDEGKKYLPEHGYKGSIAYQLHNFKEKKIDNPQRFSNLLLTCCFIKFPETHCLVEEILNLEAQGKSIILEKLIEALPLIMQKLDNNQSKSLNFFPSTKSNSTSDSRWLTILEDFVDKYSLKVK